MVGLTDRLIQCTRCGTRLKEGERHACALPASTAPGVKHDSEKPQPSLIPAAALLEIAQVMTYGAQKYAPDNWRHVENGERRYMDALLRHAIAHLAGEENDEETGLSHLAHLAACACILIGRRAS